ncbi:MAG: DUF47 family protein, partial [Nitrososphaerales archaeon]
LAAVTSLQSLIRALRDDRKSAVSKIHAVDDCEELADIEKNELLRELFSRPRTMDPVTVIQLRDFIFASDNIADNAESAGDVIMVLVAKGYG